jgi:hypothetical protein
VTVASNVASTSARPGRSPLSTAAQAVIGSVFAGFLALVGITFIALAIAFPTVVPLIQDRHLAVSASDLELAKAFASVWWAFAVGGVLSFFGSVVTIVKLVRHLDPAPTE